MYSSIPNAKSTFNLICYYFVISLALLVSTASYAVVIPNKIPQAATDDPLFAKGFLNVSHYGVITGNNTGTVPADNVALINQAIKHAYNRENDTPFEDINLQSPLQGSLSLYFPPGVYWVNDTIKAHTATGGTESIGSAFDKPRNHLTIVGSTLQSSYPVIRLIGGAPGFNSTNQPKHLIEFVNWDNEVKSGAPIICRAYGPNNEIYEQGDKGYNQMIKGLELHCNSNATTNTGCVGLFFNQAQNSSVENVRIRPAHTGIKGSAAPGVMANIEIIGGTTGIDTLSRNDTNDNTVTVSGCDSSVKVTEQASAVITNLKLNGQTGRSIYHRGAYPMTIVGFEITTPSGSTNAAITTFREAEKKASSGIVGLIDGVINLGSEPSIAAIDNRAGKNIYVRNVYVNSGSATNGKLIKSATNSVITANGSTKRIAEYNYTKTVADGDGFDSFNLIDCAPASFPSPCRNKNQYAIAGINIISNSSAPPLDLASRHAWLKKPSVDDANAYDISNDVVIGTDFQPITLNHNVLQNILNTHPKVFIPKGIYKLTGSITLGANNILFGAGRGLTRIETADSFPVAGQETPIITTVNNTAAKTYIGELSIGVNTSPLSKDYLAALIWKAGASSMVHIGQVYRSNDSSEWATNAHSLLKITGSGGGRWYGAGAIKTLNSKHKDFRILKVEMTTQPLWLYSLDPEHSLRPDTYTELNNAMNVRIYGIKSEYNGATSGIGPDSYLSSVLRVTNNSQNIGIFGHSAMRNGLENKGAIEVLYSSNVVAALIAPHKNNFYTLNGSDVPPHNPSTLKEVTSGGTYDVAYPHTVTLFKKGDLLDSVMVHTAPSY